MEQGNKILFWFRECISLDESTAQLSGMADCTEIIPVFCFDPRERGLIKGNYSSTVFQNEQIHFASSLRNELQKRGSNLLVVNQAYETIIPSLARVLNVNQVVTNPLTQANHSAIPEITSFRNEKALEVRQLLGGHSIPLVFKEGIAHKWHLPVSFPKFPEINPGSIPVS